METPAPSRRWVICPLREWDSHLWLASKGPGMESGVNSNCSLGKTKGQHLSQLIKTEVNRDKAHQSYVDMTAWKQHAHLWSSFPKPLTHVWSWEKTSRQIPAEGHSAPCLTGIADSCQSHQTHRDGLPKCRTITWMGPWNREGMLSQT